MKKGYQLYKSAIWLSGLLILVANSVQAQLPFKTQFVHFVEGANNLHCSIDQVMNSTYFSVLDPTNGNNEFIYAVSAEGKALTLAPDLLGAPNGNNRIKKLIVRNDSLFSFGLHQLPGSPPSIWSKIYTATDTLRYPDIEQSFSIPYDLHLEGDRLYACGQLDDTTYLLASNLAGQLIWDTIMPSNFSFSSITTIADTVFVYRHPTMYKFDKFDGHLYNFTNAGGEGVGDCVSKDGAIYWACSNGPGLFWAKHIPGIGDVWWDSLTMQGTFVIRAVDIDDFGRLWIAGNDDDGGHLIIFDTLGNPTDHVYGTFISDISIENGKVAICGGLGNDSPFSTDLKYLLVGILEE